MVNDSEQSNGNIITEAKKINWTKWRIKQLYDILTNMKKTDIMIPQKLKEIVQELYEISHRDKMNDHIYMFSRRQKAINCLIILESIKENMWVEEFNEIKWLIKNILLENRTKQILPKQHWILRASAHKTELYLNSHPYIERKVLEPREYIGIDPEVGFDLDAPSIVTALTPAEYEQPIHNHAENREVTFYTWPSIGKYYDKWEEHLLEANFWDFIIFPPKTYHTINNPNKYPVRNISIKLPWALLDRSNNLDKSEPWSWEVLKMEEVENWIYKKDFKNILDLPYNIHIYDMNKIKNTKINPTWKSVIYVMDWDFIINFLWENKKNVVSESDIIVLNNMNTIEIEKVNGWWKLYMVTLV